MKFAHIADVHLGAWREPKLQELNLETFRKAIAICIDEKVGFVIIAGDLFDVAMPSVEILKEAVSELKRLKDSSIDCYVIAGSHDFSISGKTFLDVIEKAGLCRNISKFSERDLGNGDILTMLEVCEENNCIFAGIPGKKGGLETRTFKNLQMQPLHEYENKIKIFMMHTTLTEAKPKELYFIESVDTTELPAGFDYYAAGHLHIVFESEYKGKPVIYPGPLFPNNFQELEELKQGSFCIVDVTNSGTKIERRNIRLKDVLPVHVDVSGKNQQNPNIAAIRLAAAKAITFIRFGVNNDFNPVVDASASGNNSRGGANTIRAYQNSITNGANALVSALATGSNSTNGTNSLTSCTGVLNAGAISPADGNAGDDTATCSQLAPDPLWSGCELFLPQ